MAKPRKRLPLWFEEPWETARRMEEEFHGMMQRFWARPFEARIPEMRFRFEAARPILVDVSETESEVHIRAELPGYEKNEVKVRVNPLSVEISAEKRRLAEERKETFYRRETSMGVARRVVPLPAEVLPETAKARFEHGVLEITVKKKAPRKVGGGREIRLE